MANQHLIPKTAFDLDVPGLLTELSQDPTVGSFSQVCAGFVDGNLLWITVDEEDPDHSCTHAIHAWIGEYLRDDTLMDSDLWVLSRQAPVCLYCQALAKQHSINQIHIKVI